MKRKLKRSLAVLAATAVLGSMSLYLPDTALQNTLITASAKSCFSPDEKQYTEGYFVYHRDVSNQRVYIHGNFGSNSEVTVPEKISGFPVYGIEDYALSSLSCETIYLPPTIGYISNDAFFYMTKIMISLSKFVDGNIEFSYKDAYVERHKDFTTSISALNGYSLPTTITVKDYDRVLTQDEDYTYDNTTGQITVYAKNVDLSLSITAKGETQNKPAKIRFINYVDNSVYDTVEALPTGYVEIPISKIETDEMYTYSYFWNYSDTASDEISCSESEEDDIEKKYFVKKDLVNGNVYDVYVVPTGKDIFLNYYVDGTYSNVTEGLTPTKFTYGDSVTYATPKAKDGYCFDGWYLNSDYTGSKFTSQTVSEYKNTYDNNHLLKLYGRYTSHSLPADFDSNGFKKCSECNEVVYQPATETTDKYDIDDDGTKDTVYEISNAGQLYWFAGLVNGTLDGVEQNASANAILTANITVNENLLGSLQYDTEGNVSNGSDFTSWTPIGENWDKDYTGAFDGYNKTVSGLYFNNNSSFIGLFGSSEGNIKNVGVVDSYFKGDNFVGGVCGNNDGTITNCYNTGNLLTFPKVSANVGGVCGCNTGSITNCYNTGTVIAPGSMPSVGGVCGSNNGSTTNCYNVGTVTATASDAAVGGVCGVAWGSTTNCYYNSDAYNGDAIGYGSATAYDACKTTAQFASGEVAYLLSQGKNGSVWGQNLATENYPLLNGKTVYQVDSYEGCIGNPGNSTKVYSNTDAPIYAEHDYSSKEVCTICGAFKNGIGEHLDGYSLSLDGNIGVNFFMELDKSVIADENAYIQFRLPNGKTSEVLVSDAKQQTVSGTTYYIFSCEVAAKEMNETITAQIITSDKKGEIYEYSVADYIQYIRDNPTEFDEKTLSLVNAMAGYGDYAKAYFNNENLDANTEMDAVTADTLASFDKQISGDLPEGITYYGSSLLLESNTTMRHYFKVAEGTDISALSFSGSKGNYYYIDIPNISAEKLGTIQNVTIGNCTISYSPMSYAYAVLSSKNTSESLKNLVKSLYLYEQAAEAYKN